jgi:hypothetical protein
VQQEGEIVLLEQLHRFLQQSNILPDTAAKRNFVQIITNAQIVAHIAHYAGHAVVEARSDDGNGNVLAQVGENSRDERGGINGIVN